MSRQLPHLLTLSRLAAAPWVAWLLLHRHFREALAVVLLAGLTDWFDGFAARRLGVSGKVGVVLDPLADKTLLVTLFFALAAAGLVSRWLFSLVMGRDLVIVIGAVLLRTFRGIRQFLPSALGKVSTFFQITFVLMVLLFQAFPHRLLWWVESLALILTSLFTTLSGLDYVRLGLRLARQRSAV